MQAVATIVGGPHSIQVLWIADGFFEIDHAVEAFTGPDPFVHSLSLYFFFGREIAWECRAFKGRNGGAENFDSLLMSTFNHLFHSGYDVLRADGFRCGRRGSRVTQVVDSFQNDDVFDSWLGKDIAIETSQGIDAEADVHGGVVKNPIATNAGVEHTDLLVLCEQAV